MAFLCSEAVPRLKVFAVRGLSSFPICLGDINIKNRAALNFDGLTPAPDRASGPANSEIISECPSHEGTMLVVHGSLVSWATVRGVRRECRKSRTLPVRLAVELFTMVTSERASPNPKAQLCGTQTLDRGMHGPVSFGWWARKPRSLQDRPERC